MTDIVERLQKGLSADGIQAHKEALILLPEAATEIKRLRAGGCARDQRTTQWCAEAERLRAELAAYKDAATARDRYEDALRAEVAALREDAERYRYIRDNHEVRGRAMEIVYGMNGSDWDAAIDAARKP